MAVLSFAQITRLSFAEALSWEYQEEIMKGAVEPGWHRQKITNLDDMPRTARSTLFQKPHGLTVQRHSRMVCVDKSQRGVLRVRMEREQDDSVSIMVHERSTPMVVTTTSYLDGHAYRVAVAGSYLQEDWLPYDALPVSTKDITDFGRLTRAAKTLVVTMSAFGPGNEPTAEQLEAFVGGYRNLLAWRRKVHEQMQQAEGQIDAVEALLSRLL